MSKYWLQQHMREFVKPRLRMIPKCQPLSTDPNSLTHPSNLLRLMKAWHLTKAKADGCPILLAGRDVWYLYVVAKCLGERHITFRGDISAYVAQSMEIGRITLPDFINHYLVDTGYSGTVPRCLGMKKWNLISGKRPLKVGVGSCNLASVMENAPTYWERGIVNGKRRIVFKQADNETFLRAAILTRTIGTFVLDHA